MSKITLVAKLSAAEGKTAELRSAIEAVIVAADEEPGLLVYAASEDPNNEGDFWFFEVYENDEALGVHGKGDGMKAAMGAFAPLMGGRPEITVMNPVAAKGLDFS